MKKKIYDIVFAAQHEGLTTKEATDQLLVLFGAVGRSEQLLAYTEWLKKEGLLNATVTKLIVKKYQSK